MDTYPLVQLTTPANVSIGIGTMSDNAVDTMAWIAAAVTLLAAVSSIPFVLYSCLRRKKVAKGNEILFQIKRSPCDELIFGLMSLALIVDAVLHFALEDGAVKSETVLSLALALVFIEWVVISRFGPRIARFEIRRSGLVFDGKLAFRGTKPR